MALAETIIGCDCWKVDHATGRLHYVITLRVFCKPIFTARCTTVQLERGNCDCMMSVRLSVTLVIRTT